MTHTLTVTLSGPVFAESQKAAVAAATDPAALAADVLAAKYPPGATRPRTDTRRLFGSIVRLDPPSLDNEGIGADLGREYGDDHSRMYPDIPEVRGGRPSRPPA